MEDESDATSMYFCHMCSLIIRPAVSVDEVKCPHCHTGFVEEMTTANGDRAATETTAATERDVSPWTPDHMDFLAASSGSHGLDDDGDLAAFARRRYRNMTLMQLLSAIQEGDAADGAARERVVLLSPADARAVLMQERAGTGGAALGGLTLGDLILGPEMDLLLEYVAETGTSRQGPRPAEKEAVAALPTVRAREVTTCPVCLDELAAGAQVREMPCKHMFHDQCIVPWLDMHSSCPVCRYQLPTGEPTGSGAGGSDAGSTGRRHWFSWPFRGLFSRRSNGSSSSS